MASALSPMNLRFRFLLKHCVHDPGATSAVLASPDGGTTKYYIDMARVHRALIQVAPSIVGGNGITLVRIMAYSDQALTLNATEVRTSGAIQLDNLDGSANSGGDRYVTEVLASELRQLDTGNVGLRYLGVEITCASAGDEATVDALLEGQDQYDGQTATVQA